ncbi:MAG: hypothetical protein MJ238_05835, partial [Bacilli bacterium]|nr:hypothetical protein [Bacilli bacterium]
MKKTKLLVLLSLPMFLAACGNKGGSLESEEPSSKSENSSLNGDISSSEDIEIEQSEEEALDLFAKSFDEIKQARKAYKANKKSFTEESVDNYTLKSRTLAPVAGGEISMIEDDLTEQTDWYTISYNDKLNIGYYKNDDNYSDDDGKRTNFRTEWYDKIGDQYRQYDGKDEEYYNVDEAYAWFKVNKRSRFGDNEETFQTINAIKTQILMLERQITDKIGRYTNKDDATYKVKSNIKSSVDESGGVKTLKATIEFTGSINPGKLPDVYDEVGYLAKYNLAYKTEFIASYTSTNVSQFKNITTQSIECETINNEGKTTEERSNLIDQTFTWK